VVRVPGFAVCGVAHDGMGAIRKLGDPSCAVDLVLLDMHLPDLHGLDVVRAMRTAGNRADVIAVTSARDLEVVRPAVSQGVVQYLLKPFAFAALRDKLVHYAAYREQLEGDVASGQHEVDRVLATLRGNDPSSLQKARARTPWTPSSQCCARARRLSPPPRSPPCSGRRESLPAATSSI
jgi:response regulator of citrate/malate metabolism